MNELQQCSIPAPHASHRWGSEDVVNLPYLCPGVDENTISLGPNEAIPTAPINVTQHWHREAARKTLDATIDTWFEDVCQQVRADAFEEAAQAAEDARAPMYLGKQARDIAARIRALGGKP